MHKQLAARKYRTLTKKYKRILNAVNSSKLEYLEEWAVDLCEFLEFKIRFVSNVTTERINDIEFIVID